MALQLALEEMDSVIREQIGRELLAYMVEQANGCARLAESFNAMMADPRVEVDRTATTAAWAAWAAAAGKVAEVCNVELRRE